MSNGENVSPEELEMELSKNPQILEVLAKEQDKKICAVIYCAEEHQEEIRAYITNWNRGRSLYKRVTRVEFVKEPLPRTSTGKIKRH